ncbi:GNAT family N-acetyltransferase [Glycomyces luteolus]|uniref:GNAT family N-acetyltransferase n=1 Tax=Glycomyces luteolus TaxID=2670330 RepID=A0A9X3PCB9_9ACTN|nr:GNAT family N-acetyltransferase [Glycomyces luteolus]MDA1360004.1 GNAT family N-acetyltransferase [Glycomyces luteolus]
MKIIEFSAADPELIAQAFAVSTAAHRADTPENPAPVERFFTTLFTHAFPGRENYWFACVEDGTLLGHTRATFFTDENRELAMLRFGAVHPDHRDRGVGTALLDHVERFSAEHGRTTVLTSAPVYWENGPARDERFARLLEDRDYSKALTTVNRRSPVDPLGPEREAEQYAKALAAAGDAYEVRQWIGAVPDDLLDTMCRMETMIISEIPLGEIEMEVEHVTPEKLRGREAVYAAEGRIIAHSVALDRTGEIVAWTEVGVDEGGYRDAHQAITIVDPAHRGHRLGLLLKLANLRQIRERFPHVEYIWTDNADVNAPMIAINELLNYTTVDASAEYQKKLGD